MTSIGWNAGHTALTCASGIVAALAFANQAIASPSAPSPQAAARPNVLFILMDDLGWRDVGYAGSTFYETPAIDQLARDGLRFDNAYVAYPRCTPSRYALMTGRNPARAQIPGGPGGEVMKPEERTIAEAFRDAGYTTFFAGKWHLSHVPAGMPDKQGFDINIAGGSAGATASHFFPYGAEKGLSMGPGLENGKPGEYLTDRLTDETIAFMEQQTKTSPGKPFFAYLSHYAVHTPLQAKPELKAKFDRKLAAMGGAANPAMSPVDGETKLHQDNTTYAAMIASMDESVAHLRAALDRLGIAKNTIIVFTSDHGGLSNRGAGATRVIATSNLPLRAGKGHLYEGGLKVPMVVYWPGHTKAATINHSVVINTDHFPTLLQAAGIPLEPKAHVDGQSYLPAISGKDIGTTRANYWYNQAPRPGQTGDRASAAMREGNWKYYLSYDPAVPSALFDLAKDPEEKNNLASSATDRAKAMRTRLENWLTSINAAEPNLGSKAKKDNTAPRVKGTGKNKSKSKRRKNAEAAGDE